MKSPWIMNMKASKTIKSRRLVALVIVLITVVSVLVVTLP